MTWRKSSYSGQDGSNGNCVEVAWRKSTYSGQDHTNGACVEVAFSGPAVAVRDSKNPDAGRLTYPERGWATFLAAMR